MSVTIVNWRYCDGYNHSTFETVKSKQDYMVGWHCSVITDTNEFVDWLSNNCPSAYYSISTMMTSRGKAYHLHITDQAEAAHFSLKWL